MCHQAHPLRLARLPFKSSPLSHICPTFIFWGGGENWVGRDNNKGKSQLYLLSHQVRRSPLVAECVWTASPSHRRATRRMLRNHPMRPPISVFQVALPKMGSGGQSSPGLFPNCKETFQIRLFGCSSQILPAFGFISLRVSQSHQFSK